METLISLRKILPFLIVTLLLGGCASSYSFKVDAINNPEAQGHKSYKLVSSDSEVNEADLDYKEVAAYVKTILSGKGFYEAPDIERAHMIVEISYGIGEPEIEFRTYTSPVYATRGGGTRTVTVPVSDAKGNISYTTTVIYDPPRRELVDFEERIVPITTYEKFLRLTAYENSQDEMSDAPLQLWSVHVKNKDESDDLRKYLPLMAAAAVPYVSEDTENQQEIKLKEKDEVVAFIKEGT